MSSNLPPDAPLPMRPGPETPLPGPGLPAIKQLPDESDAIAIQVQQVLQHTSQTLVLAESCTAGLIAATLGRIPGVSAVLAGSAVVYQVETKAAWLGVSRSLLDDPGPVSREVAEEMASRVLAFTPHASVALSITGHLGPEAPRELDGVAWCAVAVRGGAVTATRLQLSCESPDACPPPAAVVTVPPAVRRRRQVDAVRQALQFLHGELVRRT